MANRPTHFREYCEEDTPAMYDVLRAAAIADQVDEHSTLEGVPSLKEFAESFAKMDAKARTNVVIATDETTGGIVGYGTIRWFQEDNGAFVYVHQGQVHPDHRGKGIGSALLANLQQRIRDLAAEHPEDAYFGTNVSATEASAKHLLDKDGYTDFWPMSEMELTELSKLPEVKIPEGYELRSVQTEDDMRAVYNANKAVYADTAGSTPASEEDFEDFKTDNPDTSLWKVLWHGDQIAAFVISKVTHSNQAEIMEVSTVPEFRRQGLASLLMNIGMRELREQNGIEIFRLHTGAEGKLGGRPLYESLGFTELKRHHRLRKPL